MDSLKHLWEFSLETLLFLSKVVYIVVRETVLNILPKKKKDISGEVVLITGSAQGIGRQLAIQIARLGAKVVLWDINETKLKEVTEEISQDGGSASWFVCDVTSESDVNAKARLVEQKVGEVTILINNAGIMQNLPMMELSSEGIKKTIEVNLLSHFWTIRAFLPSMEKNNHGHIVGISSCAGLVGHVNQIDYSASKHGVVGLMEALSEELRLKESNVKTTTICPLTVNTGMNQNPITKCSWMMPIVSVEDAARQIITALRREDFIVTLPRRIIFSLCFSRLLPHQVLSEFLDFTDYCRVKNYDLKRVFPERNGK
ncbi:Epidermal retinol dehydrogenase 2 [Araneus ventricosus]|uniref:Short-chain dehydrogenase/reductase 3 n=1 Tax=Araneus ventricosus TaxID=182803 RepID=A0A4Y2GP77_ARAVE|nr:Epidermal retinol dehydrogenase 2 [Araneus ventricosus]